MNQIAILLTCYNRKDITLRCLSNLFEINIDVDVYIVDDNSTDGTSAAIKKEFPQVIVIKGNGNLFWNRGMHLAWEQASKSNYEYYLWLNDDVIVYRNFLKEIMECYKISNTRTIISGVIESHDKSKVIYGGSDRNKILIVPNGEMKEITFMNGNIVFVPKIVFAVLGNLDSKFHHDLGDVDYGLRAIENKIKVFTTKVPIGSGEINDFCRVRLTGATLKKRFEKLFSPLGSNPNITFYFRKKHFGYFNAIFYYIYIIILNILPDFIVNHFFRTRYL